MSSGAMTQTPFTNGIATQVDAQNPVYIKQPTQQQQQAENNVESQLVDTLNRFPPEAKTMLNSINKNTFQQAIDYLVKIVDDVYNEPTQVPQVAQNNNNNNNNLPIIQQQQQPINNNPNSISISDPWAFSTFMG